MLDLEPRSILHLVLHAAVPAAVAAIWYRPHFLRAWLLLLAGWLIDLDHFFADPIYDPNRCSIDFHPLHTQPAILAFALLAIPQRTRLLAVGLLIHIGLDAVDCLRF